jgi:hypothetical protein
MVVSLGATKYMPDGAFDVSHVRMLVPVPVTSPETLKTACDALVMEPDLGMMSSTFEVKNTALLCKRLNRWSAFSLESPDE